MDELHLLAAARYVEMNPVAADIARHPVEYRWSSARAHLNGVEDELAVVSPLLSMVSDWESFLRVSSVDELKVLHLHEPTGRPLGSTGFVEKMEQSLGRVLRTQKPGPKKKQRS